MISKVLFHGQTHVVKRAGMLDWRIDMNVKKMINLGRSSTSLRE